MNLNISTVQYVIFGLPLFWNTALEFSKNDCGASCGGVLPACSGLIVHLTMTLSEICIRIYLHRPDLVSPFRLISTVTYGVHRKASVSSLFALFLEQLFGLTAGARWYRINGTNSRKCFTYDNGKSCRKSGYIHCRGFKQHAEVNFRKTKTKTTTKKIKT